MLSRQRKNFSRKMPFILTTILTGCTTTYHATPADTRDLSPAQARELLIQTAQSNAFCSKGGTVTLTSRKLKVACIGSEGRMSYRFTENPSFVATQVYGNECVQYKTDQGTPKCALYWRGPSARANAQNFVKAWQVMADAAPALDSLQEAAFDRAAQDYRSAAVKPQLPEDAVRYKTQAEFAVKQKRFDDAADLFELALGVAPWWPAGHYNRGLILGELEDYAEAIHELQKYLTLEPEAANAKAVQLRIYEWESLLPRSANQALAK